MTELWNSTATSSSSSFLKVQPGCPVAALNCEDTQFSLVFSETVGDPVLQLSDYPP